MGELSTPNGWGVDTRCNCCFSSEQGDIPRLGELKDVTDKSAFNDAAFGGSALGDLATWSQL
jgi:hypothetical protein